MEHWANLAGSLLPCGRQILLRHLADCSVADFAGRLILCAVATHDEVREMIRGVEEQAARDARSRAHLVQWYFREKSASNLRRTMGREVPVATGQSSDRSYR